MYKDNELKEKLGIDESSPIPADYSIPYFVHQDDMNKLDMSHKRVEKWILGFAIALFIALVATNAYWIYYENQFMDEITVTQDLDSGDGGDAIINDGVHIYGESATNSN